MKKSIDLNKFQRMALNAALKGSAIARQVADEALEPIMPLIQNAKAAQQALNDLVMETVKDHKLPDDVTPGLQLDDEGGVKAITWEVEDKPKKAKAKEPVGVS